MATLNGKLIHPKKGHGKVVIDYDDELSSFDVPWGLAISSYVGHKRQDLDGAHSWSWSILRPDSETLMAAAACALGLMSPGMFADFLEERIDELVPQMEQHENYDIIEHVRGVITELRRVDPALAQTEVTSG